MDFVEANDHHLNTKYCSSLYESSVSFAESGKRNFRLDGPDACNDSRKDEIGYFWRVDEKRGNIQQFLSMEYIVWSTIFQCINSNIVMLYYPINVIKSQTIFQHDDATQVAVRTAATHVSTQLRFPGMFSSPNAQR